MEQRSGFERDKSDEADGRWKEGRYGRRKDKRGQKNMGKALKGNERLREIHRCTHSRTVHVHAPW